MGIDLKFMLWYHYKINFLSLTMDYPHFSTTSYSSAPKPEPQERTRGVVTVLHGFLLVLVGFVFLFTLFTVFSHIRANRALAKAEEHNASLKSAIAAISQEVPSSLVSAKETVDQLNAVRIEWSQVLSKMLETAPSDVFFRSYSGTPDGKVVANALTTNVPAVANTIKAFVAHPDFRDVFVSNVARGVTDRGQPVVSFSLSFRYSTN